MFYDLNNDLDRARFRDRVNFLFHARKKVEVLERREVRTLAQNNYLHLILSWYALETGYTLEEVKQDIFKRQICRDIFLIIKGGREVFRSTADINTLEMTNAIERFRNHSANDLGIYLPAPHEEALLLQMEYEVRRFGNRQYL